MYATDKCYLVPNFRIMLTEKFVLQVLFQVLFDPRVLCVTFSRNARQAVQCSIWIVIKSYYGNHFYFKSSEAFTYVGTYSLQEIGKGILYLNEFCFQTGAEALRKK